MKVRFIGTDDPTDNAVAEAYGITFERGKTADVPPEVADKLKSNPTFEVVGKGD
jgi:hypothetical protein